MNAADPPVQSRRFDDLPGPRGLPLIGSIGKVTLSRIHQDFERWAREFGPAYRVRFGPRRMLVLSDHGVIASVLRERPHAFRRPQRNRVIAQELGMLPGVFAAEGDAWRHQRRMVMASFSPGNVRAYLPSLQKVATRLRARWALAAREGRAIDLQADLMRYTVDTISGLAFGSDVNTLESDDNVIQKHLDKIFPALFRRILAMVPVWRFVKRAEDRQVDESVREINRAIDGFIAKARERLRADPQRRAHPANLLEGMIVAADEAGSGVTDRDVAGNVMTMLLAGEDTTANTLAWMIYLLQRHPAALQRAREEVRRVAPDPSAFTADQLASLDFVEACANETMRLKPVAPLLPIETTEDTVVAGIAVPANTQILALLRHPAMDEANFPGAGEFRPERWLDETAQSASSAKRVAMPFGSGPRVCPGRYLAMLEIKMAMAMLLSCFDIEAVDTPDGGDAKELLAFTMSPVGLRMRLREL